VVGVVIHNLEEVEEVPLHNLALEEQQKSLARRMRGRQETGRQEPAWRSTSGGSYGNV